MTDLNLNLISVKEIPSKSPDNITLDAIENLEHEKLKAEIAIIQEEKNNIHRNYKSSNNLTVVIVVLVISILITTFGILIWQGILPSNERLNDSVLITMLTATPVEVISALILIAKYIFHHRIK